MKLSKTGSLLLSAVLLFTSCPIPDVSAEETMRDITTMELVRDMGIGINLGNTFEACPDWYGDDWIAQWSDGKPENYETAWGSPVITKEIIEGMAEEGFGVLRIPVAWSNRMAHDGTYTIDADYDARVHQIVDWTIGSGMYAIINIHWDGGWVNKFPDDKTESMKRFTHMWEQIADSFKDYSDYLMFESQNEELGWESIWNPWGDGSGKAESYALCNEINQAFVDTVRKSGGNNDKRHLLISGYNTGFDRTCDPLFKMPNDPANRMAVSVHYYNPAGFAILEDEDASWAKARSTWGTEADFQDLNQQMDMMKTNFIDKGIPVIVGEYGCPTKGKEQASVRLFLSSVCKAAYERQLCPVLWSTPDSKQDDGTILKGHYDRTACKMTDQELQKLLYAIGGKSFQPKTVETEPEVTATAPETTVTEPETTPEPETTVTEPETTPAPESETTAAEPETTPEPETQPAVSGILGDIDNSGAIDVSDAVLLARYINEDPYAKVTNAGIAKADADKSGSADSADVIRILQIIAHFFPQESI